jgi:hypothetical protein
MRAKPVASASALRYGYIALPPNLRKRLNPPGLSEPTGRRKLSTSDVQRVKALHRGGHSLRSVAARFHVSYESIRSYLAA